MAAGRRWAKYTFAFLETHKDEELELAQGAFYEPENERSSRSTSSDDASSTTPIYGSSSVEEGVEVAVDDEHQESPLESFAAIQQLVEILDNCSMLSTLTVQILDALFADDLQVSR